jgi:hypothetical protein
MPSRGGRNGGTTVEGGGGVTGKLTRNISVYGDASFWVRSVASNASPSKASLVCVRRGVLAVNKRPTEGVEFVIEPAGGKLAEPSWK